MEGLPLVIPPIFLRGLRYAQNVGVNSTFEQQRQVVNIIAEDDEFPPVLLGCLIFCRIMLTPGVATVANTETTANYAATAEARHVGNCSNYAAVVGMSTGLPVRLLFYSQLLNHA